MEKLLIKSNGQWELKSLKKMAWGDPDYEQISHGDSPFKTKEAASEAKSKYISKLKDIEYARVKNMSNLQSGKEEPHILLHRGMGSEDPIGPKTGSNMIDWSSGDTVKTTTNSIHTLHPDEAQAHAQDYSWQGHGKTASFWVPISSIHGHCHDINRHIDPKGKYEDDDMHTMIKPGEYRIHDMSDWRNSKKIIKE